MNWSAARLTSAACARLGPQISAHLLQRLRKLGKLCGFVEKETRAGFLAFLLVLGRREGLPPFLDSLAHCFLLP
jgi:hypothetical protein